MNIIEVTAEIEKELLTRNLSNPNIRLRAMNKLIEIIKLKYPNIYKNPQLLKDIDKDEFKNMLAVNKDNGKLNDAESSIVNEIYYKL